MRAMTFEEQRELGEFWEEIGAPTHEAVVQYYPQEGSMPGSKG